MQHLANQSIQLVVTSPPYPMIDMWDGLFSRMSASAAEAIKNGNGARAFDAMHRELDMVWKELWRVLVPGGIACINIGDATRRVGDDFRLYANHSRIISGMEALGFASLPLIHWRKTTNAPTKFMGSGMLPSAAYVTLEHEYILIFRKGGIRRFNAAESAMRRESAIFWEERNAWFSDLWQLAGSRQALGKSRERSAAFPFELAFRLVLMHSIKGDTVLDPFVGTGTTLYAAGACERSSIGIEIEPELTLLIARDFDKGSALGRERNRQRLMDHNIFVQKRIAQGKIPKHHNKHHDVQVVTSQEREMKISMVSAVKRTTDRAVMSYEDLPVPTSLGNQ